MPGPSPGMTKVNIGAANARVEITANLCREPVILRTLTDGQISSHHAKTLQRRITEPAPTPFIFQGSAWQRPTRSDPLTLLS